MADRGSEGGGKERRGDTNKDNDQESDGGETTSHGLASTPDELSV